MLLKFNKLEETALFDYRMIHAFKLYLSQIFVAYIAVNPVTS